MRTDDAPADPDEAGAATADDAGKSGAAEDGAAGVEDAVVVSEDPPVEDLDGTQDDTIGPGARGEDTSADHMEIDFDRPGEGSSGDGRRGDTQMVAPPPTIVERRGPGFVPLVLGGLLAGAIGYAIPTFLNPDDDVPAVDIARVEALEAEIARLNAEVPPDVDLSGLEGGQADLGTRLSDLSDRIDALEARPAPAEVAETAAENVDLSGLRADIEAVSQEIAALREEFDGSREETGDRVDGLSTDLEGLRADLGGRLDTVETRLDEVSTLAETAEADAEALAREAARNEVTLALQSGAPYAEPLSVLEDVPEALAAPAETGVPTVTALATDFTPLAREALRAGRAAEGETGMASLFRNAVNARSLEPREGDDTDAILSRAEAALRDGDVEGALAEVTALPEAAQAVLADWIARARTRVDAVAAGNDFLMDG
ncbi:mitofilin family membrane protein [Jannaschia sp. S6380]|uniref:COG4223 family protein n=1 Tax=Jannaschia sp. S6380 TaxID=2926408 RepID=UPI001FF52FAD|nr:mitofilin family membrane protein [Jannaschia sp. S6380]MCK0169024.1 mitofilin family membrane protein [Jannaschia sp. S6380]